ncbi:unnamed protein product [Acanthocheilonema viteae]|uniref:Apple domain-containing protein n=1 Tax=Acanthocheilonema viteae TaxID=6277 RepID=A0A498S8E9_ACAVI|nr:unnamed protein product [Acanthocheilonema viteae]
MLTGFVSEFCPRIISVPLEKIKYDISTLITIDCIKCKLKKELDGKESLISSETNESDELSPFLGTSLNDTSLQPLSLQNTIVSNSGIDVCEPLPMRCQEDIWFIAKEQTNSGSSDFFEETVTASSVRECAEKCFDKCCKIAVYSTIEKKCQLTRESKSKSSDNCETMPFSYVNQYNGSDWIKITCVACGSSLLRNEQRVLRTLAEDSSDTEKSIRFKEEGKSEKIEKVPESAEVSQSNNPDQPITTSAVDTVGSSQNKRHFKLDPQFMKMTCVVVFEVDPEANIANFKAQDSVKADRILKLIEQNESSELTIVRISATEMPVAEPSSRQQLLRVAKVPVKDNLVLRTIPEKPQTKSSLESITTQPKTSLITSKKHLSETTAKTNEQLMKITLVPDVKLNTAEMESKEIEKDVGTTTFIATNGNMEISDGVKASKDEAEDTVPVEATQTTPETFVETGSRSSEQTGAFTENVIVASDAEIDASATAISAITGNTKITTTSKSMIGSSISDMAFESNSRTESGMEISGSMSSNGPVVKDETEPTRESEIIHATVPKILFAHESNIDNEELNSLHKSTAEANALPSGSESKMEFDRAEPEAVSSTHGETITTSVTGTVEEEENKAEQSSTIISSSTNAGITDSEAIDDRNRMEAKTSKKQDVFEDQANAVHISGITTATLSNSEGQSAASNNSTATFPKQKSKNNLLSSKNVNEESEAYLRGCIVTFQADPHNKRPAESSTGFQSSTIAQTAEVCAGRCYQDGCTGARYDPSSKECVLGYSGKQICSNGPLHFFYEANETIWIHCTGCKLHKPGDKGFNIKIHSPKAKVGNETGVSDTVITSLSTEAQEVKSTKPDEILTIKSEVTPKVEENTEHIIEGINTETETLTSPSSVEGISTEAVKVSITGEEVTVASTTEKKAEISEQKISSETGSISTTDERMEQSMNCTLLFQVRSIDTHFKEPITEFIPTDATSTVKDCVKHCYMNGCVGAKFDPTKRECLLTFGDHHQCDENEQQHHSLETTEPIWIHCISCKKELTESTLGLLAQDATTSPVTVEKLKKEEHSATDENSSTLEPIEIEEKFSTSISQGMGLESVKKAESQFSNDSDEIDSKSVDIVSESSVGVSENEKISFVTSSSFGTESVSQTETIKQEIKSKEFDEEFGTSPTAVAVEEETSRSSTSQSSMESLEIKTTSTASGSVEDSIGTSGSDELDTTVQPDVFTSLILQTPLSTPTDNSELSNTNEDISGSSRASVIDESTQTSKIESGEQKDQKDGTEFQEEAEPTMISSDNTVIPSSADEVTDDIAEIVSDIVANISSNILETNIKETTDMPEGSHTESHETVLSLAPETAIVKSDDKAMQETPHTAATPSITEETESVELDTEVTSEKIRISDETADEVINEITAIAKEISTAEETSTVRSSDENGEETSGLVGKVVDETLSSISVPDSITEQSFAQADVDDIIRKVAQSKDILVTDIEPSVADTTVEEEEAIKKLKEEDESMAEVDKSTLSNTASTLIDGDEHVTTEPPVQAVSDLISVLSQNSKIEEVIKRRENENDAFVVDDMPITKNADYQTVTGIVINQLQESFTKNSLQNIAKIKHSEGAINECLGRIEFEILEVEDLSQLNVTSEIIIESPAACATKCYNTANCVLAVYKPSQNDESANAVCMLTSNPAVCTTQEKSIPQHKADLSPFIISCLKCTKCNYTIGTVTELTRINQAEIVEPALSIGQCGEICWKHNCTVAQYDHRSNLCSLTSVKGQKDCPHETPIVVNGDEPVLLECVRCFA